MGAWLQDLNQMSIPATQGAPLDSLRSSKTTKHLKQAHARILKLDSSSIPTVFHYNPLIRALAASTNPLSAVSTFRSLLRRGFRPNNLTFPFLLKACCSPRLGAALHTYLFKSGLHSDPYIQSALIHMYSNCTNLAAARQVFDQCPPSQTVCWNSMLGGYVKNGKMVEARDVFDRMECRDVISWNTIINCYALHGDLKVARELFAEIPKRNVVSWNSMLAGHAKCGDVEGARRTFDEMPVKDVVSWNAMLACYAQSGKSEEALMLFNEMCCEKVRPTEATIVSLLSVCAHLGELNRGELLHAYVEQQSMKVSTILGTALVDMYAKCGDIARAVRIFDAIAHKDVLAWNTIIAGTAVHGHAQDAFALFYKMVGSGIRPDDITFIEVLRACSHAGMVQEGRQLLDSMKETYGIVPKVEHYGCIIDLFARAGLLEQARELIEAMPIEPNAPAWGALLGGCRIHGNMEVGEDVGKHLLDLQPNHSGRYILLSNLYAAANMWEKARKIRSIMISRCIAKLPGLSMVEFEGTANQFRAGDMSHPETDSIYKKLAEISVRLNVEAGYSPDTEQVLLDIEEEEKEHVLAVHSEKLALSFGLLHTSEGDTIRVFKNLRVCKDCHNVMKLVSLVYCREIIMRDRSRFHHFKGGSCSCMDFW